MFALTLTWRNESHTTLHRSFGEAICYYIECSERFGEELEMELCERETHINW